MKLLPHRRLTIISALTKSEASEIITQNTSESPTGDKTFYGTFTDETFTISRVPIGRKGFPLKIKGHIETEENQTSILLTFEPSGFSTIFIAAWFFGAMLAIASLLWDAVSSGSLKAVIFVPVFFLIFGAVIINTTFTQEFDGCKKSLEDLLKSKETIEHK